MGAFGKLFPFLVARRQRRRARKHLRRVRVAGKTYLVRPAARKR